MPKIPSDDVTAEEAAALLETFGTVEQFLARQRAWMWREVEKKEARDDRAASSAGLRAKFPVIAPPEDPA